MHNTVRLLTLGCTYGDDINDVYIGTFSDTATGCSTVTTTWQLLIRFTSSRRRLLQLNSLQTTPRSTLLSGVTGTTTVIGTTLESTWSSQPTSGMGNVNRSQFLLQYRSALTACAFVPTILTISATESCSSMSYGEAHDYNMTVTTPPACPAPTFASITTRFIGDVDLNSNDTTFVVEYGTSGFVNGLGLQVTVNDTFATIMV